jgi:hypothetical protein
MISYYHKPHLAPASKAGEEINKIALFNDYSALKPVEPLAHVKAQGFRRSKIQFFANS